MCKFLVKGGFIELFSIYSGDKVVRGWIIIIFLIK